MNYCCTINIDNSIEMLLVSFYKTFYIFHLQIIVQIILSEQKIRMIDNIFNRIQRTRKEIVEAQHCMTSL